MWDAHLPLAFILERMKITFTVDFKHTKTKVNYERIKPR